MEKPKKTQKSSISKSEYELIEKIRNSQVNVFSAQDVVKLLGWKKSKAYFTIHNLKNKGVIMSLINGRYTLSSVFQEHEPFSVASHVIWPSYISFWSALNFYKFTEQLPRTIFVATTKAKKEITFEEQRIKFVSLSKERFFGYREANEVTIAEKEKAIVDSLLLPRYSGGINEIAKCLKNAWGELNKKTLAAYSLRMRNKSLVKRLGYLIEKEKLKIEKKLIEKLQRNIGGEGYSKLEPQLEKKGRYDKRWGLIINIG